MKKIHYFYIINFLAAFLLFQIELIITKVFLPKFGGSYLVWGACVVFFQCALLLGYFYSHVVVQKFGMYRYSLYHVFLILLPLLVFPGRPLPNINTHSSMPFVIDIFFQLLTSIGLVFFVLSTISIISQSWLAASHLPGRTNPYILYAISNIGSFLALLTYPFLFENIFDLNIQLKIWRIAYFVFVVFYLIGFKSIKYFDKTPKTGRVFDFSWLLGQFKFTDSHRIGLYWFLLSASASMLFLSVTNIITYEVAPCPLFWIIPLCIYLISFVLNFKEKPICPSWVYSNIHVTLGLSAALFFLTGMAIFPLLIYAALYFLSLFAICMFSQYELYATRPNHAERLTSFYLTIAAGSVAGSILVAWIVPLLFTFPVEYLLGLLTISVALVIKKREFRFRIADLRWIIYLLLLLVFWPKFFKTYNFFGIIMIYFIFKEIYKQLKSKPQLVCISLFFVTLVAFLTITQWQGRGRPVYSLRNYYGIYSVTAQNDMLNFFHGSILHGAQSISKENENEPLSYFHRRTPIGKLMQGDSLAFKRVGVIGLGIGTLAAYGKPGQEMDFFELDPDVYKIAQLCFSYLKNSAAKINYVFGDARLTLDRAADNYYDILIVDAFNGDSVPVHLLTIEAMQEYKLHIKKDGLILFHVGNKYIDLVRILSTNARIVNAPAYVNLTPREGESEVYLASFWLAMTWDKNRADILASQFGWRKIEDIPKAKRARPWTDTYSNVSSVFRIESILGDLKSFAPFYW